jgi:hypothetical protein
MSLEDQRADLDPQLPPLRPPTQGDQKGAEDAASEGANPTARRSGLYIALGMIMLLTVLVYLNMG